MSAEDPKRYDGSEQAREAAEVGRAARRPEVASDLEGLRQAEEPFRELALELARARAKFPGNDHLTAALMEEVGEMAQAYLQGRIDDARTEAVQVACVAWRIVSEGDAEFEAKEQR